MKIEIVTLFPDYFESVVKQSIIGRGIEDKLFEQAEALYEQRENELGAENMRVLERLIMLRTIDSLWTEHLTLMEDMRLEAGWQTLRQVKAVDAYKNKGYEQFQVLLDTIRNTVTHTIYRVSLVRQEARKPVPVSPMAQVTGSTSSRKPQPQKVASSKKVGRNDPCPCGSGKKYKHCCGK